MAMSRSFGGRSLTSSPPIKISPDVTSSRPAIIRSVVLLPQPEGPTSTTSSLSGISRLMPRTASTASKRLVTLRRLTSAMISAFRRPGCQAGDVVVHQEGIDDERRRGGEQCADHKHTPIVGSAADQAGHGPDGQD